ncbi:MAG: GTPase HflX, partial [Nitrospina sp.]|nr:GTPase HflX [Nitrospina sp.]
MTPGFIEEKVTEQKSGKAILVGVGLPTTGQPTRDPDLDELRGLATTAHYTPVADITQRLTAINPKTLIGSGKVEQIVESVRWHEPDVVIFDEALTPAQNKNLEKLFSCRVIDRHWLILEIFSEHARTREAKTQVELARLKYALPRLTKLWGHLSRQRGGIGLKEVGEKQIQLDKRLIRDQIHKLEKKLKDIDRERAVQRKSRRDAYQAALVGYTNVGKSTLMNCLTDSATLVENKLFATLDATVRKVTKNFPYPILMTDTVGLIDKLPHDLVASFKSTIDEVRDADLLLHVVDISHPEYRRQMKTAEDLLNELGAVENADILLV